MSITHLNRMTKNYPCRFADLGLGIDGSMKNIIDQPVSQSKFICSDKDEDFGVGDFKIGKYNIPF